MRLFLSARIVALALSAVAFASGGTITIPNNGSSVFFQEAPGASFANRSLGQTFVVPSPTSDNVLTSFSFSFFSVDAAFSYRAMIFAWDTANTRATGSALFSSGALNGTNAPTFNGLNLALTPGTTYIALLTTQNVVSDGFQNGLLNHNSANVYAGGQAFQQSSSSATGANFTNSAWSAVNGNTDFQFNATFTSATPEPSTFALALVGLAGAALGLRRRRS